MEEKNYVLDPFTGEEIVLNGARYRRVRSDILDWLNDQCARGPNPARERTFCGTADPVPEGYTRRGTPYECMRKGVKLGICAVYNKMKSPRVNRARPCPICGARAANP